ncbi:hypothetical protein V8G54_005975 [Vigna mungo]|uniref:Uncharacterized protein n=1 Tax=Vigna mungo TaxID=3915 RepID=A0AAQ3P2F0_VIGMU
MAARPTLAGSARNKAIDVFPLSITQAFRIAMNPLCFSMPDTVSAMLQITNALARITEKRTAAAADIKLAKSFSKGEGQKQETKARCICRENKERIVDIGQEERLVMV